jgi:predicted transcriptional regulator
MATPEKEEQLGPKLDAILNVMRDLVILESAKGGLSRDQVRKLLGVSPARVSRIWKHLKKLTPQKK